MFRELEWASWTQLIAIVAFLASVAIFLFFLIGAFRMSKKKIHHDAALPLADEQPTPRP